jgi:predicted secreted protein
MVAAIITDNWGEDIMVITITIFFIVYMAMLYKAYRLMHEDDDEVKKPLKKPEAEEPKKGRKVITTITTTIVTEIE